MSIDARVETVIRDPEGSGQLTLVDRPAEPGGTPGCAGQRCLRFEHSPANVGLLTGLNVWGGSSSLVLGDVEIARREGYTRIVFRDESVLQKAFDLKRG